MFEELLEDIRFSIARFTSKENYDNTLNLLNVLGYYSNRLDRLVPNSPNNFINTFDSFKDIDKVKAKFNYWDKIDFIFQYSTSEIEQYALNFNTLKVDNTIIHSYIFLTIELRGYNFIKNDFREISFVLNKHFLRPCFITFKYTDKLAFSIMDRRINKTDEFKDVIKNLHILRDIDIISPQDDYVKLLYDLSLPVILKKHPVTNFVELHNVWKNILNKTSKHFVFDVNENIEISQIFMEQEHYESAISYLDFALQYEDNNEKALENRALCFFEISEYEDSLQDCEALLSINPHNNVALNILAMLEKYNKDEYKD